MRYLFLILIILFIIGCNKKTSHYNESNITKIIKKSNFSKKNKNYSKIKNKNIFTIESNGFNLSFNNKKLIYPKKKMIILFYKKNFYSQEEERILTKLNVKFYKTNNQFLINYFKIKYFPTIIILDKNQTIKFENFTPYEILKTEGF